MYKSGEKSKSKYNDDLSSSGVDISINVNRSKGVSYIVMIVVITRLRV